LQDKQSPLLKEENLWGSGQITMLMSVMRTNKHIKPINHYQALFSRTERKRERKTDYDYSTGEEKVKRIIPPSPPYCPSQKDWCKED